MLVISARLAPLPQQVFQILVAFGECVDELRHCTLSLCPRRRPSGVNATTGRPSIYGLAALIQEPIEHRAVMAPSPMLRAAGPRLDHPRGVAWPAQIPETWTVPGQGNSPGGPAIFCYVTVSGFTGTPDQTGTVDQTAPPSRGGTIDQTVPHGRTGTPHRADAPRPAVRAGRARLRYRPAWSLIAGPAVT